MNILEHKPKHIDRLRPFQEDALKWIDSNWYNTDVFVLSCPTATGKSIIASTLMNYLDEQNISSTTIVPNKILQDQYGNEFNYLPVLKGMDNYICKNYPSLSCHDYKELKNHFCKDCKYSLLRERARNENQSVLNYYTYFANKLWKEVLIIDEAHKIKDLLCELSSLKLWKHKTDYPNNLKTIFDFHDWLREELFRLRGLQRTLVTLKIKNQVRRKIEKYERILTDIRYNSNSFFMEYKKEIYRGHSREMLFIKPLSAKKLPPRMWPDSKVRKIVLLSATIGKQDIVNLGLDSKRVSYFECTSPIPKENRPFRFEFCADMSYKLQNEATPSLCRRINEIIDLHKKEKGIVHIPYGVTWRLKKFLTSKRFLWYDKNNKEKIYEKFRKMKEPKVLIAPGMTEGIDLAYDLARFQIIAKIQYPSLSDNYIKKILEKDEKEYLWQTVRSVLQATGRVCRDPKDYGITYCLDIAFAKLYKKAENMFPQYFKESITWNL